MDKAANRFVAFMAIIATPLAAGAFLMAWGPGNHYFDFSPANDGYVAPRDISTMISETENSTVTVICDVSKTRGATGTGWAIDASLLQVKTDRTAIVTNHHVIEQCIGLKGSVAFGNILNVTNEDILITNNISQGNSGGALIDNEGKVIGVVTWGMNYQKAQYNGAGILDIYCAKILKCEYEWDGEPTWFDYSE